MIVYTNELINRISSHLPMKRNIFLIRERYYSFFMPEMSWREYFLPICISLSFNKPSVIPKPTTAAAIPKRGRLTGSNKDWLVENPFTIFKNIYAKPPAINKPPPLAPREQKTITVVFAYPNILTTAKFE
jgi:hypothetical protein